MRNPWRVVLRIAAAAWLALPHAVALMIIGGAPRIATADEPATLAATQGVGITGKVVPPVSAADQMWHADGAILVRTVLPHLNVPPDFLKMTSDARREWYGNWEKTSDEGRRHVAQLAFLRANRHRYVRLEKDVPFASTDLPAGDYLLRALFFPRVNGEIDYNHEIATAGYEFKITAAQASTPLKPVELGKLQPRALETFNADQPAPDIAFEAADGSAMMLSQFRGKVVLLDFWGVWCPVCQHDLPNLIALYGAFKSNPHFAMVSLDVGDERPIWQSFVDQHDMGWTQCFLGARDKAWQARAFAVQGYPSYWVIGPDGQVLGEGFQCPQLRPIIEKALGGMK
jgi:thiol-disulfide isomerase/thioredoxin